MDNEEEEAMSSANPPDPSSTDNIAAQSVSASAAQENQNATTTSPSQEQLPPSNTKRMRPNNSSNNNNTVDRNGNSIIAAPKKVKTKHLNPLVLDTRRTIQQCCKTNDFPKAYAKYREALAQNIRMEAPTFYSLLNLCDGLDHRKIHVGTPRPTTAGYLDTKHKQEEEEEAADTTSVDDLATRKQAAFAIKERMDELQLPLNETAYTALVKILTRSDELTAADALLQQAEQNPQHCRLKLRLYVPLLQNYCAQGQLHQALKLWERLEQQNQAQQHRNAKHESLQLGEAEYAALIQCCANYGGRSQEGNAVVTAHDAAQVVQKVFTDLSEDVLVPSQQTTTILVQWFQSDAAKFQANATKDDSILTKLKLPSSQVHEDQPIGPVQCSSPDETWKVSPNCRIDTSTGKLLTGCLQNETLQPIRLSAPAWQEMLTLNETIVLSGKLDRDTSAFQGGKKGKKRKLGANDQEQRKELWQRFNDFLQKHNDNGDDDNGKSNKSFDIIIDGANVGYYQQNFGNAPRHVDYRQIDSVVQHFRRLGKKVLLVMHCRHFTHHQMPARFRPILQHWQQEGILYQTPAGMNDDWFWMHAALVLGPGTLVLTNDEMRDHHFQMLSPRSFLRWKDRHQVHFSFGMNGGAYNGVGGSGYRPVLLEYPEIYSRRIQRVADGYVIPHPKRGDENRFLDGTHEANEDTPVEETYLCIRPTRLPENDAVEN